MKILLDSIRAVAIGHAVGDALGVPAEFRTRASLDADPVTEMVGYGSHSVPAGTWSDDTSMAIAALDALADGAVDYDRIMWSFCRWVADGAYTATGELFDIGGTCLQAIRRYAEGLADPLLCGDGGELANGNGSLMRIYPFVLYASARGLSREARRELIENGSRLTHAHACARVGCLIYADVLEALLVRADKAAVREGIERARTELQGSAELARYERILEGDLAALSRDAIRSSGYVVDTLEAALWCLLTTDSYRACVLKVVNLGEDTDTVAAVAGSLAGALYGYEGIPAEWREALIASEVIETLCARAQARWQ